VADCESVVQAMLARSAGEPGDPVADGHLAGCPRCQSLARQLAAVDGVLSGLAAETATPPPFERLEDAARAAARRRRRAHALRRRLPPAVILASAMALTAVVVARIHRPPSQRPLAAGDVLDASAATRHGVLRGGTRVTVASGKVVVESSDDQHGALRVIAGSAFLEVPPLGRGQFLVRTDEAEVRVHGTRFEVARDGEGTRVVVDEGLVEVRPRVAAARAFFLHRGEAGTVGTPARQRREARAAALAALGGRRLEEVDHHVDTWLAAGPPDEEVAEAQAVRGWTLSGRGDTAAAIDRFRRALALLPPGMTPLWADNAGAQLALLLERTGSGAAEAWSGYLQRFPEGTHAALARDRLSSARSRGGR
jgi:hypothetical protein